MDSDAALKQKILYLLDVEKLGVAQTLRQLHMGYQRFKRLLCGKSLPQRPKKPSPLESYRHLLDEWYRQYPRLQALQIHRRLKEYGFTGSRSSVERYTRPWRIKKPVVFHALDFIGGQEAQVDWFFADLENSGRVALFLYVLSYSRYAWGKFYPRTSFEFFLDGHLECFKRLNGFARTHRYDNLKSVVIKHTREAIEYNPQFLEFATHYGFKIHACNPYKGNEKGRVERLGRTVRESFLYGKVFKSLEDLNTQFWQWLSEHNNLIHRSTGKTPLELLPGENLLKLPAGSKPCQILAYPEKIEIMAASKIVARHKRSFDKHKIFQNPLHRERLLNRSPLFKHIRILQLVESMDPIFYKFLRAQGDDESDRQECAYQIFKLLKTHSRALLVSAVGELLSMGTYKIKALFSLLSLPAAKQDSAVFPNDPKLLDIRYQERSLEEYDQNH